MSGDGGFVVSAPGKIILTGEHAVVYGQPALVAALQRRTYVHVTDTCQVANTYHVANTCVRFKVHGLGQTFEKEWSPEALRDIGSKVTSDEIRVTENLAEVSMKSFAYLYAKLARMKGLKGMYVIVKTELFIGAGLGSSASFAVSLSAAMLLAFEEINEICMEALDVINSHAFELETLFHGQPSGADNTTCCYGNIRCYRKDGCHGDSGCQGRENIENVELNVCVVNTGVGRSTRTLVDKVRNQNDRNEEITQPILKSMGAITTKTFKLLQKLSLDQISSNQAYEELSELIEYNQKLLETLQVSHVAIEKIREISRRFDLGAKLTGAGGGGCVYILMPPDFTKSEELYEALNREKLVNFHCRLGGEGVKLEDIDVWNRL